MQSIPRDTNNVAPRVGFSWDPLKTGKTVLRGSYGIYYGHPLTALNFLADVVDGANSPFLVASQLTGVEDLFQGRAFTPIGTRWSFLRWATSLMNSATIPFPRFFLTPIVHSPRARFFPPLCQ